MKKSKIILLAVAVAGSQLLGIHSSSAQQFYPASISAESATTNPAGNLVYHELSTKDFIQTSANEQGITNLTGLSLVFDAKADALEVVSGTNDTLVFTTLTFADILPLSNTNGTSLQRFASVYWGASQTPNGTLVANEQIVPATATQPARFSLQGQIQIAVPAIGTNAPTIIVGNISAETPEVHTVRGPHITELNETNTVQKTSSSKPRH